MNRIILTLFLQPLVFVCCQAQQTITAGQVTPVAVVELFTSQGCSSCPAADKLLARYSENPLHHGVTVYELAFHVDYWDYLGWKDVFSAKAFSNRQRMYVQALNLNGAYTPQMVVNGSAEFVGSDEDALNRAVLAVAQQKPAAQFTQATYMAVAAGGKISYTLSGDISGCDINIALVSAHETTAVKRGENGGRRLYQTNVVKEFSTQHVMNKGALEVPFSIKDDNSFFILYLQNRTSKKIITAIKLIK